MAAVILAFPNRAAEAEAAIRATCERLAADAEALDAQAAEYFGAGHPAVSWSLSGAAAAMRRRRAELEEWAAARDGAAAAEPEPGRGRRRRYAARPCAVPGCMARARADLDDGSRCGLHATGAARRRAAAEVRRARERLHAAVRRMP